jgi:putative ABC transport system permease protein
MHVEGNLAVRQVLRHRTRSTLTSGVLFVAGCTGVAMASSILDNVANVKRWYQVAIPGDFFIRAMLPNMSDGTSPDLPEELRSELEKVPKIKALEGVTWITADVGELKVLAVGREYAPTGPLPFDVLEGDPERLRSELAADDVVVSNVLAQKLKVGVGDSFEIDAVNGKAKVRVCGVVSDYMGGGMTVHMTREHAIRLLHVEGYDAFIVRAERADLESLREQLQAICDNHGVLLHSHAEITGVIDGMVIGIDGSLWGLIVLGFVVAAFGVVNTLTMSVLEQTRELGLMRIIAMTKRQVRHTILMQAVIIGSVGLVPGVLVGVLVAYLMNLLMLPTIGRTIEFGFHPWLVLGTLASALCITVVAAWIPAQRAARLDLVQALHYE